MSTQTENLGLTKPEIDENFQLSVWNGNTDILDEFAGQVNTALAGARIKSAHILPPTGDATDRAAEILSALTTYGECELLAGEYYCSGFEMPEGATLKGAGKSTIMRLPDSVTNGYCVRIHRYSTVQGVYFKGGDDAPTGIFVDGTAVGTRHGIYLAANADESGPSHTGSLINRVSDCFFEYFSGGGFTAENTGTGKFAGVIMDGCTFRQCMVGINIPYYSEYSKFTDCVTEQCNVGCLNNGGNNVFTACTFHGVRGFVLDNSSGTKTNNGHGTCAACTFNHIDNMNRPSTLGGGLAIDIRGTNNGFLFTGCQFWYASISIASSRGVQITDSFFAGGTPEITVTGDHGAFFKNCVFQKSPTVNANAATRFVGCIIDNTGVSVRADPLTVGLVNDGRKNILNATAQTQTVDTVTLTSNADGSYTVSTASATTEQVVITIGTANLAEGEEYVISGITGGGNTTFFLNYDHSSSAGTGNTNVYMSGLDIDIGEAARTTTVKLYVRSGQTVSTTLTPMICRKAYWQVTQDFVPYRQ